MNEYKTKLIFRKKLRNVSVICAVLVKYKFQYYKRRLNYKLVLIFKSTLAVVVLKKIFQKTREAQGPPALFSFLNLTYCNPVLFFYTP